MNYSLFHLTIHSCQGFRPLTGHNKNLESGLRLCQRWQTTACKPQKNPRATRTQGTNEN